MKAAVMRVVEALEAAGIQTQVKEFAESTRTAEEAAAAIGCTIGQIVKSLIFLAGDTPILALVSGANQADISRLTQIAGAPITRASAAIVREAAGYSIGGVPPLGHATPLPTYLDRDLLQYDVIWAAAGTPNAVFRITPADLQRITGAEPVDLAVRTA